MTMRKILIALTAMMMAACSTDDEGYITNNKDMREKTGTSIVFEGVWSVDDEPVSSSAIVSFSFTDDVTLMTLSSFPCQSVLGKLLPDEQVPVSSEPTQTPILTLSSVGYSVTADYYTQAASASAPYSRLLFQTTGTDGHAMTVAFDIMPAASTVVIGQTYANCVLTVKRIEISKLNEKPALWVMNPERRLVFTSIRRI